MPQADQSPMTPEDFAAAADVSRETLARLQRMDAALLASPHNLIAKSTIADRWARHYLDSAQLYRLLPTDAEHLVDLGSGAGFPGLVLAAMGAPRGLKVTLVDSVGKKAAFLKEAGAAMGLESLRVIPARIEAVRLPRPPDVITARALARLDKLLGYGHGIAGKNTKYFFLKGQDVEAELTEAAKSWHMKVTRHPSRTSPDAAVLEIEELARAR